MTEAKNLRHEAGRYLFDVDLSTYQIDSIGSTDCNGLEFIHKTIGLESVKMHVMFHSVAGSQLTFECKMSIEPLVHDGQNWEITCMVSVYVFMLDKRKYLRDNHIDITEEGGRYWVNDTRYNDTQHAFDTLTEAVKHGGECLSIYSNVQWREVLN